MLGFCGRLITRVGVAVLTKDIFLQADECRQNSKLYIFFLKNTTILVGFGMLVAKTPNYPVMCLFPLFIALCDHNPPTLQTDRQTNQQTTCL